MTRNWASNWGSRKTRYFVGSTLATSPRTSPSGRTASNSSVSLENPVAPGISIFSMATPSPRRGASQPASWEQACSRSRCAGTPNDALLRRRVAGRQVHRLELEVLLETLGAELPPDARLLEATERGGEVEHEA